MSSAQQKTCQALGQFEDRVDILFRELELAIKWQRPSILFAVVCSECVYTDAKQALNNKLVALGQRVVPFQIQDEAGEDLIARLSRLAAPDQAVFFVDGLSLAGGEDGTRAYTSLNRSREYFIDQQVRIVFWLTEKEAVDLAHYAPDYWAFRHRVVEFLDPSKPKQPFLKVVGSAWQNAEESSDVKKDLDAKISMHESLLGELSKGEESTANYANLALVLGILHWRKASYKKADEYLKSALEIATNLKDKSLEAQCFYANALLQTSTGRISSAIEAYKQALNRTPDQLSAWSNLGVLYGKIDQNEEAIQAFRMVIEHDPKDAVGWSGLGNMLAKLQLNEDAIVAYQKAIDLAPNFVPPLEGLGSVYVSVGRTDEAIISYGKAVELNPRFLKAWFGLGDVLLSIGRKKDALKAYKRAVDLDPENARAWDELGNAYLRLESPDEAVSAYRKAIELDSHYGISYSHLASVYCRKGKYQEAILLYQKGLDLLGDDADKVAIWNELGEAYRQAGDPANADAAEQQAEQLREDLAQSGPEENLEEPGELEEANVPGPEAGKDDVDDLGFVGGAEAPQPGLEGQTADLQAAPRADSDLAAEAGIDLPESEPLGVLVEESGLSVDTSLMTDSMGEASLEESLAECALQGQDPQSDFDQLGEPGIADQAEVEQVSAMEAAEVELVSASAHSQAGVDELGDGGQSAVDWNDLGNTYLENGAYDKAIAAYIKAIELAQEPGWPYINNLAMAYYYKGKYTDAAPPPRLRMEVYQAQPDEATCEDEPGEVNPQSDGGWHTLEAYRRIKKLESQTSALLTRARVLLSSNGRG